MVLLIFRECFDDQVPAESSAHEGFGICSKSLRGFNPLYFCCYIESLS